jgi:hypothetical protein
MNTTVLRIPRWSEQLTLHKAILHRLDQTRSRPSASSEENPKKILQIRLAKGTDVDLLRMLSE